MDNEYLAPVVTLCGSTRFKDEFLRMQRELTLQGNVVLSLPFFEKSESGVLLTDDQKTLLDNLQKQKIDMAGEVLVINPGGYVGETTISEIEYARRKGKRVSFLCTTFPV